jgi:radical SAM enzyme (TIGR01210 family)
MTTELDLTLPAAAELSRAWIRGRPGGRLVVILKAPGCQFALRTGGCTNCGFLHLTTRGVPVPAEKLLAQLEAGFNQHATELDLVEGLELFCSGSFFCDEEIPADARQRLLSAAVARLPALRNVMVESRPEYIDADKLEQARAALAPVPLEVAIGLETVDNVVRLRRIKKGFSLRGFEEAAVKVAESGATLVVYLLLKPMGCASDAEAVEDVLDSARYLVELRRRLSLPLRVALEPTFVLDETPLHDEWRAGRYTPPSLWAAARAAAAVSRLGLTVHLGLSDEGLPTDGRVPAGCPECTGPLREALRRFNENQQPTALDALSCQCIDSQSGEMPGARQ